MKNPGYKPYNNIQVANYDTDGVCMSLRMYHKSGDPTDYVSATVNLGDFIGNETIMPKYCGFIDVNNHPGLDNYLIQNGYAEPYTRWGQPVVMANEFCAYPLLRFDKEKLKELGATGLEEYESVYNKSFEKVQNELLSDMGFEDDYDDDFETTESSVDREIGE